MSNDLIAFDTETFTFDRGLQAPPVVCLQWAKPESAEFAEAAKYLEEISPRLPEGSRVWVPELTRFDGVTIAPGTETTAGVHALAKSMSMVAGLEITRDVEDAFAWVMDHDTIVLHHGPYDLGCMIEWYPRWRDPVFQAYQDGRILDTMLFQRLIEIAQGDARSNLALDFTAQKYGVPAPTKKIETQHPDYPGQLVDVRTSFGLFYEQVEIPEPWHPYGLYDGIATLGIFGRQWKRFGGGLVKRSDLEQISRVHFALTLTRNWGLCVDPHAVELLAHMADVAIDNLRQTALEAGFIRPKLRGRGRQPARDPKTGDIIYSRDMKRIKAAVTKAYEGKPPLTKKKRDGTGGGSVSTAKDTLEDSGDEALVQFSEYGEAGAVKNKDLKIFERSPVHTKFGLANTMRPTSSNPNVLNFRRKGFLLAHCPTCGYEQTLDAKDYKPGKTVVLCPTCDVGDKPALPETRLEVGMFPVDTPAGGPNSYQPLALPGAK